MKTIIGLVLAAGMAGTVLGDEYSGLQLHLQSSATLGQGWINGRADAGASYSNIDNFTGSVSVNGGATSTITRLVADDITSAVNGLAGQSFRKVTFSVGNLNAVAVSARVRVRFWLSDGAGGAPGTYYNGAGFSFSPITFNANSANLFFFDPGAGAIPQLAAGQTMWAGMTFDNVGATATTAQLNNLGQLIMNPPVIGTSQDAIFATTNPGSFFGTNNPAGSLSNFGGTPVANLGWEFVVPAPGSLALIGMGGLLAGRRRR